MKKHLIAAAVAAAVAVPAMAQVTMSGRIDTSVGSAKNTTNVKTTRVLSNLLTTNQIVFSGSEDLGGGLKANFNISSGITSDQNNALNLGDRGASVGVSGGFGALNIGKINTMMSSTSASGLTGNLGNLSAVNVRPNNSISFTTPAVSGFTGQLIFSVGDENNTTATTNKHSEFSVQYAAGPLLVRAAHSTIANFSSAEVTAGATAYGTAVNAALAGATTDAKITETAAQVDYNLGMARVNARLQTRAHANPAVNTATTGNHNFQAYGIGVAVPFGATTVAADYAYTDSTRTDGTSDVKVMSLTAVNALSKRTNVYGAYAARSRALAASVTENVMSVGVRHSF